MASICENSGSPPTPIVSKRASHYQVERLGSDQKTVTGKNRRANCICYNSGKLRAIMKFCRCTLIYNLAKEKHV